jgi:hypothetical protein
MVEETRLLEDHRNPVKMLSRMMEAARTSETLVNFYQTTWLYNPEESHLSKDVDEGGGREWD